MTKVELYPAADARRDYSPPDVKMSRPSGTSVGREAVLKGREPGFRFFVFIFKKRNHFTSIHVFCSSASSFNVPGVYRYWTERPAQRFSSRTCQSSAVRNSHRPPPFPEERPSELESRLEILHSQLNR